jgi:HNH endonuclease
MTMDFWSDRYGDLESIAAATRGRCHLCHEEVDLSLYGRTGLFGADTVTVDHLEPQVWGGDDEPENLRIAHGNCNSRRGVEDPEVTRLALAKTTDEPLSAEAFNALSVGGSVAVGAAAGHVFARTNQAGQREFNWGAALACGLLMFAATRAYY